MRPRRCAFLPLVLKRVRQAPLPGARQTGPVDGANIVAALAVLSSTATAIYSLGAQSRQERQKWLRDQRATAYIGLMEYLAGVRRFLQAPKDHEKPVFPPEARARVNAFGTRPVIDAVGRLIADLGKLTLSEGGEVPNDQRLSATEWTAGERRVLADANSITSRVRRELGSSQQSMLARLLRRPSTPISDRLPGSTEP